MDTQVFIAVSREGEFAIIGVFDTLMLAMESSEAGANTIYSWSRGYYGDKQWNYGCSAHRHYVYGGVPEDAILSDVTLPCKNVWVEIVKDSPIGGTS